MTQPPQSAQLLAELPMELHHGTYGQGQARLDTALLHFAPAEIGELDPEDKSDGAFAGLDCCTRGIKARNQLRLRQHRITAHRRRLQTAVLSPIPLGKNSANGMNFRQPLKMFRFVAAGAP